jgi:dolichol-phosphate mannosyltransferase
MFPDMKLSVVIPAYNEAESLPETLSVLHSELSEENINYEILVINDNSKDNTIAVLEKLSETIPTLRFLTNQAPNGFGYAVRKGLEKFFWRLCCSDDGRLI